MKNYSKTQHDRSWSFEKKLYERHPNLLNWFNHNWNGIDQYDGEEGKPDFSLNRTNIKIEMRDYNFDWHDVVIHARRVYETNNVAGTYGQQKDLTNIFLLLYDGQTTAIFEMNKIFNYELVDNFPGKRQQWEKAYMIPLSEFKVVDFDTWANCQVICFKLS